MNIDRTKRECDHNYITNIKCNLLRVISSLRSRNLLYIINNQLRSVGTNYQLQSITPERQIINPVFLSIVVLKSSYWKNRRNIYVCVKLKTKCLWNMCTLLVEAHFWSFWLYKHLVSESGNWYLLVLLPMKLL